MPADPLPQPESTNQSEPDSTQAPAIAERSAEPSPDPRSQVAAESKSPVAAGAGSGSKSPVGAEPHSSKSTITKVLGGLGAILTSIVVGLCVKYSDSLIRPAAATAPQQVAVVIHHPPVDTSRAQPTTPAPATPTAPTPTTPAPAKTPPDPTMLYNTGPPVALFNGKDLTGFFSILGDPKETKEVTPAEPLGKNNDPLKVFSVRDGLLRVSGEVYGSLLTEKEHENYLLTAEYKWGEQTWPPRTKLARNGGILLHCIGADDAVRKCFPQCIRCRIEEGRTGDIRFLIVRPSPQSLTVECEEKGMIAGPTKPVPIYEYSPGAPAKTFIDGDISHRGMSTGWRDVKGYYSPSDAEKPAGQWNTLECYCFADTITIRLNGKVINHGTRSAQTKGKIGIFSFKAEIFFRSLALRPLTKK